MWLRIQKVEKGVQCKVVESPLPSLECPVCNSEATQPVPPNPQVAPERVQTNSSKQIAKAIQRRDLTAGKLGPLFLQLSGVVSPSF